MQKILVVFGLLSSFAHAGEQANVFGNDERRELTSTQAPWGQIGRLYGPGGTCTATLVGKDLILTAAHCVIDSKTKTFQKGEYKFYPALRDNRSALSARVKYVWWGTTDPIGRRDLDWAIARLDQPLGTQLGWMGVLRTDLSQFVGLQAVLVGYSGDLKSGQSAHWTSSCRFTLWEASSSFALHDCDATRGSSGGPMIRNYNGEQKIIAVNVAERRGSREDSLIHVPYTHDVANIAISTSSFIDKIIELQGNREGL